MNFKIKFLIKYFKKTIKIKKPINNNTTLHYSTFREFYVIIVLRAYM